MNNSTEDSAKETNSKISSNDNYEEEQQPILPAETSRDDPTKPAATAAKKKVVVITPTSTKTKKKDTTTTNITTRQPPSSDEEQKQEQSSVPAKAKEVGQSLKDKVKSVGKKTITKTEEKTKQFKDKSTQTIDIGSGNDAHDIQALGSTHLEKLATVFEDTMTEIDKEPDHKEQEKQLTGYKKLLEEQINVIDSKLKMVKRLKKDNE